MKNPKFSVSCIQNCASVDLQKSIRDAEELTREAHSGGADFICLPEFFSCLNIDENGLNTAPHAEKDHPALATFRSLAKEIQTWILLGSIAVIDEHRNQRNRSVLIDSNGNVTSRYDKIHMFDVNLPNGEIYRESDIFLRGNTAVVANLPWTSVGLTVCYDLRFAYLYRTLAQAGAKIITVPAAFTRTTGRAHWHVLLRSRAIETGCYIVAPCQYGDHGQAKTYGHSLIVDPWGRVIADGGEDRCIVSAELDMDEVDQARRMVPALQHDQNYDTYSGDLRVQEAV